MKLKENIERCIKDALRSKFKKYITIWERPVLSSDYNPKSYHTQKGKVGIVIQGPVYADRAFTLETIKQYKKIYPDAVVILSTWDDTPADVLGLIQDIGAEIVINKKPVPNGANFNLQMVSTINGIKRASELGCEFVCKTRSDHRMYAADLFPYLINLLSMFPADATSPAKGKIIAINANTYRTRYYGITDMWQFGYTADMLKYWGCDPARNNPELSGYCNEQYLCATYLQQMGCELKWTEEDSLKYYVKYFIVIDTQSVDLFSWKCSKEYIYKFYDNPELVEFGFKDWINEWQKNAKTQNII